MAPGLRERARDMWLRLGATDSCDPYTLVNELIAIRDAARAEMLDAGEQMSSMMNKLLASEPSPPLNDDFFGCGWRREIRSAIDKWRAAVGGEK